MIVVTDLDGTLLDHHSYSFDPARPVLAELARRHIPVILNTSKTRAELTDLQRALGLQTPFVVENGSAIYSADQSACRVLGAPRVELLSALGDARIQGYRFSGYADMSVQDVVQHTGLSEAQAQASMAREFTEPLVWEDTPERLADFAQWIKARGLQCLRGGRFVHVMGRCDKGLAMQQLIQHYYTDNRGPVVALGDSENDLAMLEQADIAVCIRSYSDRRLEPASSVVAIHTDNYGPQGWAEAMTDILNQWGRD
ncbi:HAD-IIB family hydrolase [Litorivivens sp.]|uniref:HAD-IIB family hydrolase n=1 Tax=Litorivivens sp. TaxID=2020868 RepID=UPI00356922E7